VPVSARKEFKGSKTPSRPIAQSPLVASRSPFVSAPTKPVVPSPPPVSASPSSNDMVDAAPVGPDPLTPVKPLALLLDDLSKSLPAGGFSELISPPRPPLQPLSINL